MRRYESHWKDFNSPLFRNEIWVNVCPLWPTLFHLPFVHMGIFSRQNAIEYFMDMKAAQRAQVTLIRRVQEDPSVLRNLIAQANLQGAAMNRFTAQIARRDLTRFSVSQLERLYTKFATMQTREYAVGVLLVLLDVSLGIWSLDRVAKDILQKQFSGSRLDHIYSILTSPTRKSFARQQEEALLSIYAQIRLSPRLFASMKRESAPRVLEMVKQYAPDIAQALARHTKKWAWTYYVYAGPAWTESEFIETMQDWARRNSTPNKLFQEWKLQLDTAKRDQRNVLQAVRCLRKEKEVLELLSLVVWAKPRRKDYQSRSYWHMEHFFREVARRLGITLGDARSLPTSLMWPALRRGQIDTARVRSLFQTHLVKPSRSRARVLSQHAAERMMHNVKRDTQEVHGNILHGSPACHGKAIGIARIINSPADMGKMRDGDVLVSVATTPSIIAAMRKASAIVTDEGGLTCHAAIVSRELKIPCVVGLHYVTQALKDGDRVEVDATRGIVKKITK